MGKTNILSIDMDYILEPSINLYSDMVVGNVPREKMWKDIERARNIVKYNHLTYSKEHLEFIIELVGKAISEIEGDNIFFLHHHDRILEYIAKEEYTDKKLDIWNLDHHHDIYYGRNQKDMVDIYDSPSSGNWLWYLDKYNLVDTYTWVRNPNSLGYDGLKPNFAFKEQLRDDNLLEVKFDKVFIVLSPNWYPPGLDSHYHTLKKFCETLKGIEITVDENIYCADYKSKPLNIAK